MKVNGRHAMYITIPLILMGLLNACNSGHNVVVVGSYTTLESGPIAQQGLLYIGAPDGSTTAGYKTLYPVSLVTDPNDSIINTLGHSTMGGMVVGNYDTRLLTGQAFIYNIATDTIIN